MSVAAIATRAATAAGCRCALHCAKCAAGCAASTCSSRCIALGSMAIAGVGSLSASLARRAGAARPGHPRRRSVVYAHPAARSTPDERAFLDRHGKVSSAATMRAMARTADGKAALVEMKAVDGAYPLFGQTVLDPPGPLPHALAQARRRFRRCRGPGAADAARHQTRRAADHRQRDIRNPRRARERAGQARRRHRLRAAPAW